jgi:hypothetical protein
MVLEHSEDVILGVRVPRFVRHLRNHANPESLDNSRHLRMEQVSLRVVRQSGDPKDVVKDRACSSYAESTGGRVGFLDALI